MSPDELIRPNLWWHGPKFLQNSELHIKKYDFKFNAKGLPEERKTVLIANTNFTTESESYFNRFSSFTQLQRTIAYLCRFCHNARQQAKAKHTNTTAEKLTSPFTVDETQNALNIILKNLQNSHFSKEILELKTIIIPLNPFLDQLGLLRVGGRLSNAEILYSQKRPILLP